MSEFCIAALQDLDARLAALRMARARRFAQSEAMTAYRLGTAAGAYAAGVISERAYRAVIKEAYLAGIIPEPVALTAPREQPLRRAMKLSGKVP